MPRGSRCRRRRLALAGRADAILLGAVGGPKWPADAKVRPEQGLLQLRKSLGLFANLRPVVPHPAVLDASPIKAELLRGVDIMVVRELTGGIYFGDKTRTATEAVDVCRYTVEEIERVVRLAARLALGRSRKLCRSTRPMCSKPRACGVRWSSGSCRLNFPT
jgi:3-isopropylmalate dehydrogenase